MLQPKNFKFLKKHKKRSVVKKATNGSFLCFGSYGLKIIQRGILEAKHIESCKRLIKKKIKKIARLHVRLFPDWPVTSKPGGVRMGKGKGNVSHWTVKVPSGKVLFEIEGGSYELAYQTLLSASEKLPLKAIVIKKGIND